MNSTEQHAAPRCHAIIKLGGSAITDKSNHAVEILRPKQLAAVCESVAALREQLQASAAAQVPLPGLVLIHGAGSFGHPQAAAAGLSRGGSDAWGFAATRASVTTLNSRVVAELRRAGVPAVGISPCGAWTTKGGDLLDPPPGLGGVEAALAAALVPVLHGDAVFDTRQRFAVLSGDTLMRCLAAALRPRYAVFLTDVEGLLDSPPGAVGADAAPALVPRICVLPDGAWRVARRSAGAGAARAAPLLTTAVHDTTGGMAAKLAAAAAIAAAGVPVVIAQADSVAGAVAVVHGPDSFEQDSASSSGCCLRGTVVRLEE